MADSGSNPFGILDFTAANPDARRDPAPPAISPAEAARISARERHSRVWRRGICFPASMSAFRTSESPIPIRRHNGVACPDFAVSSG